MKFTDRKHIKVLEYKNKKKEKDVHFQLKIDNNYVIGWYFLSIVYIAKNIYSVRNNNLESVKVWNLSLYFLIGFILDRS